MRTINRVILQDYGVVITMQNSTNKLIFKIKDKNEYLYGNEAIVNFQFIRESLNNRKQIELQILEVSVYDKEQYLKYIFQRSIEDVNRAEYRSFPWPDFMEKNKDCMEFLMWHVPDEHFTHPETFIDI
jgi:RecJ-like exonuclease